MSRPSPAIALRHEPLLDLYSAGRPGSTRRDRFTAAQLEYIRRTVRRTPEVMVKVTGGGRTIAGVRAHLAYLSHAGEAEIEDDRGEPVDKQDQKALVRGWHLELSSGQYRPTKDPESARARLSSCTTWCFRCPPPRRRVRCWPQLSTSPVRTLVPSTATSWHCIRTNNIRTFTSSSRPSVKTARGACASTRRCYVSGGRTLHRPCGPKGSSQMPPRGLGGGRTSAHHVTPSTGQRNGGSPTSSERPCGESLRKLGRPGRIGIPLTQSSWNLERP